MQVGERVADGHEDDALGLIMYDAIHRGQSHYSAAERRAWLPAPNAGANWAARLAVQQVCVARQAGAPMGFMTLDGDYIDLAFVAAHAQGRGVFRALYGWIETGSTWAAAVMDTRKFDGAARLFGGRFPCYPSRNSGAKGRKPAACRDGENIDMTPEDIAKLPYRPCAGVMLVNAARSRPLSGSACDRHSRRMADAARGRRKRRGRRTRRRLRELEEETGVSRELVTVVAETRGLGALRLAA